VLGEELQKGGEGSRLGDGGGGGGGRVDLRVWRGRKGEWIGVE
jgi:hypothetical protein